VTTVCKADRVPVQKKNSASDRSARPRSRRSGLSCDHARGAPVPSASLRSPCRSAAARLGHLHLISLYPARLIKKKKKGALAPRAWGQTASAPERRARSLRPLDPSTTRLAHPRVPSACSFPYWAGPSSCLVASSFDRTAFARPRSARRLAPPRPTPDIVCPQARCLRLFLFLSFLLRRDGSSTVRGVKAKIKNKGTGEHKIGLEFGHNGELC
jgi:hypothetical protein